MNWQDELKKEIEDKTLLDFDSLDWQVLIPFIKLQLKKQRDICIKIFEDGCAEVPLKYSYEEDARYNYPEREDKIYQGLKNAPEPEGDSE